MDFISKSDSAKNIKMIGTDYSLAGVDERALFSFTKKSAAEAMKQLCEREDIHGCIILSTCNRMELWIDAADEADISMLELLCELKGQNPQESKKYFAERSGKDAAFHLFQTTSGLKSLILGEDQILTQVKDALALSRENFCTDSVLETLFRMAITGAKKVKTGMQTSMTNSSAVEKSLEWLKKENYSVAGKKCLVIGNGEMGKRAANAFRNEGAHVTVTVRQYRSGVVEIPTGCERINYGDRLQLLPECDIIISATSSPNMTLKLEEVEPVISDREQLFIDLAVPRDIDPEIAKLKGKTLKDIDDFAVEQTGEIKAIIDNSNGSLEEQLADFMTWYEGRGLLDKIDAYGRDASEAISWRMEPSLKKLQLGVENEAALSDAVKDASAKVIKKMLYTIRSEAGAEALRICLDALGKKEL